MDKRSDRGEFYPGGDRASAPAPGGDTEKVDRVNVGEIGESYTLKTVKEKVNQLVRVVAPAATCIAILAVVRLLSPSTHAATAPLEDIPNTAHVVTNEEDSVAMAAIATATNALQSSTSAEMSELRSDIQAATNNLTRAMVGALAAESNRVETTYAKRSEIPTAPDLAPYALKSELPTDYVREGDITNFATRAWIRAQGYATEAGTGARLDGQDLAISAATNAVWRAMREGTNRLWAAQTAASNRVNAATNAIWIAHKADANALRATDTALSNRLEQATREGDGAWRAGTNATMRALRAASNELARADARLDAKIEALELTGGMTRLWSSDATTYQDATGCVWRVDERIADWNMHLYGENNKLVWDEFVGYWHDPRGEFGIEIHQMTNGFEITDVGYPIAQWIGPTNATEFAVTNGWETYTADRIGVMEISTNFVTRVAYTNEVVTEGKVRQIAQDGTNYTEVVATETANRAATAATNYTDAATKNLREKWDLAVYEYLPWRMESPIEMLVPYVGKIGGTNMWSATSNETTVVVLFIDEASVWKIEINGPEAIGEANISDRNDALRMEGGEFILSRTAVVGESQDRLAKRGELPDTTTITNEMAEMRAENALVYRLYQGSNVVAEVTNFNSNAHAPELRIMQLNESNEYVTVWAETNGLARTYRDSTNYTDAAIAERAAPRAWSGVTAGMGVEAPSNTTWLSTGRTVIAGGLEYEKHLTSGGAIWLLESNGMAADFHPQTNNTAFIDLSNADGTPIFRVEKTDSFLVGVHVDSVTVDGNALVCGVGVVAAEHPLVRVRASLTSGDWAKEEDGIPASLATVEWSGTTGNWTCRIQNNTGGSGLFAQMAYFQEGGTKIVNSAALDVSAGILCTDGIHKVRPVYSNGTITWEVVQ